MVNHTMTQVEVRCQAKDLPEFIEVDMSKVALDDVVHLSHLKLPKGVNLTVDVNDGSHDAPVVSIHMARVGSTEEATEVPASAVPTVDSEEKGEE